MASPGNVNIWEGARYYKGKPWMEGGRSDNGVDCLGHVILACHRAGFGVDPSFRFGRRTPVMQLRTQILKFAVLIRPEDPRTGYHAGMLLPSDVTCYDDGHGDVHLGVVTPGTLGTPLQICYVPYKKSCIEVPIYLSEYKFRWVFRFPDQDVA